MMKASHFAYPVLRTMCVTFCALVLNSCLCGRASLSQDTQISSLEDWFFGKDSTALTEAVKVPHSYNALDGHTAEYFRGKGYYKTTVNLTPREDGHCVKLLFEGAAQAAQVYVNGIPAAEHKGGYTPFFVDITKLVGDGENEILVVCDNSLDLNLAPILSDFNKNGGLHNPVKLMVLPMTHLSTDYGLKRLHVSTPQVSRQRATITVQAKVENPLPNTSAKLIIKDAKGRVCFAQDALISDNGEICQNFTLSNPHLWNGTLDPYLYCATVQLSQGGKKITDAASTAFGVRSIRMDREQGFFLNGEYYPLRGTSIHQDLDGKASAMTEEDFEKDYEIVRELGCNFVRLAHYPHNDIAFDICDRMGLIVQTEIPWVNICGVRAQQPYFDNLQQQMTEMVTNLYNHPSIAFWGMWNEVDDWSNHEYLQGMLDEKQVAKQTAILYDLAKSLDPYRFVGLTDCSLLARDGYPQLKSDYMSQNRYNGWYYATFDKLLPEMVIFHESFISNLSEYGAGVNPYCQTWNKADINNKDNAKHPEQWGNLFHESHLAQIEQMPWLNFTSIWVLFDFAVAARREGYLNSSDGINFTECEDRMYINDKGLVTRDRSLKKDSFYLYKSKWNKSEQTVYITGRRLEYIPAGTEYQLTVYSNASSLTLYNGDKKVQTMEGSGEITGVIWKFDPIVIEGPVTTLRVVSESKVCDSVTIKS